MAPSFRELFKPHMVHYKALKVNFVCKTFMNFAWEIATNMKSSFSSSVCIRTAYIAGQHLSVHQQLPLRAAVQEGKQTKLVQEWSSSLYEQKKS